MKRMALFVEGQTEYLFTQRLITEIAGRHHLRIEGRKFQGGKAGTFRGFCILNVSRPPAYIYEVLIYDCGNDNRVVSDIRDQYESLVKAGYHRIVGIRDSYPSDPMRVEAAMAPHLPSGPIPVKVVLAIAEIEAWFLAEENHYSCLNPRLIPALVARILGEAPEHLAVESVAHPSATLNQIYSAVGIHYSKRQQTVQRTVDALDCANLYLRVRNRVSALGQFIEEIDQFLNP